MYDLSPSERLISSNIRYFLKLYKMSQLDLANSLGVGTTAVSNWCNGHKIPRMNHVDSMCKIFGCSRSDILDHPGAKSEDFLEGSEERLLIAHLRSLNSAGRESLFEYVDFLVSQEKYQKKTPGSSRSVG